MLHPKTPPTLLCLVLLCAVSTARGATIELDQGHMPGFTLTMGAAPSADGRVQTYTAGLDGTLQSLNLWITTSIAVAGDLIIELRDTPTGSALGAVVMPRPGIPVMTTPHWFAVDFSAFAIDQAVGQTYAIVVRSDSSINLTWRGTSSGDPYAGGMAFRSPGGPPINGGAADYGFQTFVMVVPEPGTGGLCALGLLGLGVARGQRRKREQRADSR